MDETSGSENISPKLQRVAQRQRVRDGEYRLAASPCSEEPYAVVPHVRICGSPGRATASGHPAIGLLGAGSGVTCAERRRRPEVARSVAWRAASLSFSVPISVKLSASTDCCWFWHLFPSW